ncbi:hypothetical protein [Microcoleus sp. B3-D7]|uniref:hypothetical protein n=1 Tax=Microcoleus sp. B3-D7 TaxID=2818659 RepID=UPI002FD064EB
MTRKTLYNYFLILSIAWGQSILADRRSHNGAMILRQTSQLSSRAKAATKSAIASVANVDKELAASARTFRSRDRTASFLTAQPLSPLFDCAAIPSPQTIAP